MRGDAGQADAAGAVFDDDQGVDPPQEHGVRMDEAGRDDAAGLSGQELLPGRAGTAWCWVDPGSMQDLPYRRCCDRMAELDEFALHPAVPQAGVSVAMRTTSLRIMAVVDGRPGRRWLV